MDQVILTVIIPVYNVERFVKRAINSVLVQPRMDNMEVIIIDDGSTDNSGKICDELALKAEQVRVFHQKNKGVAYSRNYAVSIAKGKYCAFLDADDWWDKEFFDDELYNDLSASEIDIYGFSYRAISSDIFFYNYFRIEPKTDYYSGYGTGRFAYYPFWAFIYRVDFLKENNLEEFLVKINEDSTFTERCFCVAHSIRWIDRCICNHWNNMSSVSRCMKWNSYFEEHYKSFQYMREWHLNYYDTYDVDSRAAIIFCIILPDLCANSSYKDVRQYVDSNEKLNMLHKYDELSMKEAHKKLLKRWIRYPKLVWFMYRTIYRTKQDLTYYIYNNPKLNHFINVILYTTIFKHQRLSDKDLLYIRSIEE